MLGSKYELDSFRKTPKEGIFSPGPVSLVSIIGRLKNNNNNTTDAWKHKDFTTFPLFIWPKKFTSSLCAS